MLFTLHKGVITQIFNKFNIRALENSQINVQIRSGGKNKNKIQNAEIILGSGALEQGRRVRDPSNQKLMA